MNKSLFFSATGAYQSCPSACKDEHTGVVLRIQRLDPRGWRSMAVHRQLATSQASLKVQTTLERLIYAVASVTGVTMSFERRREREGFIQDQVVGPSTIDGRVFLYLGQRTSDNCTDLLQKYFTLCTQQNSFQK
jgi:hypothetical protein